MEKGITITVGSPDEVVAGGKQIAKYGVGKTCRGKVVNFKPYGFFVETEDGGFGLVHGRNIKGWDWSLRFDRVFRHGTEVEVTVVDVEAETNRLSFACEMPAQVEEEKPAEPVAPAPTRKEIANRWSDEEPEKSQAAFDWLSRELADGPIYGPLTNVLSDRFDVPVPVSHWIRQFPDFTCYSGKGDNPSDLPAVALSARAGDVAYWDKIKVRTEELSENRNRTADDTAETAALAKRLDSQAAFPGARWIADYMKTAGGLVRGKGLYGEFDVTERLVIPMLGQLGWDISPENAALVRGDGTSFNVRIYGGRADSGNVSVAVLCASAGTPFGSLRGTTQSDNVVERVLTLYNRLGGDDPTVTKVVWTDGVEWVVFTREVLAACIGILADHRGLEVMDALDAATDGRLRKVTLPTDATPLRWLAAFADLRDLLGK